MSILETILEYLKVEARVVMPELEWKGLCEKIEKKLDDDSVINIIAQYQSNGEFGPLDWDSAKAQIYFRKDGNATVREADGEELISCDTVEEITWNLKAVFCATKDFRQNDDAYTADQIALALKSAFTITNNRDLLTSLSALSLISRVTGTETDIQKIADEEQIKFDYNHTFVMLKMTIAMQVVEGCFNFCE